jgi:hypothetical protein
MDNALRVKFFAPLMLAIDTEIKAHKNVGVYSI